MSLLLNLIYLAHIRGTLVFFFKHIMANGLNIQYVHKIVYKNVKKRYFFGKSCVGTKWMILFANRLKY